jgi:putative membrane protein
MWNLLLQIASGILGLYLADRFVSGVDFTGPFFVLPKQTALFGQFLNSLVFVGSLLGILNYFVKPILNKITFPLRIITFNLSSLVIAMGLVWLVDIFSPQLIIKGIKPLFFTTLIVWLLNLIFTKYWPEKPKSDQMGK